MWLFGAISSLNRIRATPLPMIDHDDRGGDHFGGERRLSTFGEARVARVSPLGQSRQRGGGLRLRGGGSWTEAGDGGDQAAGVCHQRLRKGLVSIRDGGGIISRFLPLRLGRGLGGISQFGDARNTRTLGRSPFGGDV